MLLRVLELSFAQQLCRYSERKSSGFMCPAFSINVVDEVADEPVVEILQCSFHS